MEQLCLQRPPEYVSVGSHDTLDDHGMAERISETTSYSSRPRNFEDDIISLDSDDEVPEKNPSNPRFNGKFHWRSGINLAVFAMAVITFANFLLLIAVIGKRGWGNSTQLLQEGKCKTIKTKSTISHLAINVASTMLLGSSNFIMQCLTAPTRKDIDWAHGKRTWLEIGVQSIYNLRSIPWWRGIIWAILLVTSFPIHLLYNSVVFSSLGSNDYIALIATETFLDPAIPIELYLDRYIGLQPDVANKEFVGLVNDVHVAVLAGSYKHVSNEDCVQIYNNRYISAYRNVVAITNSSGSKPWNSRDWSIQSLNDDPYTIKTKNPVRILQSPLGNTAISVGAYTSGTWMCGLRFGSEIDWLDIDHPLGCDSNGQVVGNPDDWGRGYNIGAARIQYCLVEELEEEKCGLYFHSGLMLVVFLANVIKLGCMIFGAKKLLRDARPLLTIGDAVESFIRKPDPTTKGYCLSQQSSFRKGRLKTPQFSGKRWAKLWEPRWVNSSTSILWIASTLIWIAFIPVISVLLDMYMEGGGYRKGDAYSDSFLQDLKYLGFGDNAVSDNLLSSHGYGRISAILISNIPQIGFTATYLLTNSFFTRVAADHEWSSYYERRAPLRVSHPLPGQKGSAFLSLKYRFSVPLTIHAIALHWLTSQAFFYVDIAVFDAYNTDTVVANIQTLAVSPLAMFIVIVFCGAMVVTLFAACFVKLPGKSIMPRAGASSSVISAACWVKEKEREDKETICRELKWGVVEEGGPERNESLEEDEELGAGLARERPGHCAFSADEVGMVRRNWWYA